MEFGYNIKILFVYIWCGYSASVHTSMGRDNKQNREGSFVLVRGIFIEICGNFIDIEFY